MPITIVSTVVLTPAQQAIWDQFGHVTFALLVAYCGGWNEVFDAILDDTLPREWRTDANMMVNRDEIRTRALYRLARMLEKISVPAVPLV